MKLKELAIEGGHLNTHRTLQLGRFSDGLTTSTVNQALENRQSGDSSETRF